MGELTQEISRAIKTLKYSEVQIKLLDFDSGKELYYNLLDWFVKSGDRRWWWEDFKQNSFDFPDYEKSFEKLIEIIPDLDKNVWLMVEDDQEEFYPIYDCQPSIIGKLIGECFGFEYCVIDKKKDWLICENHHNRLIGLGQKLKEKILIKLNKARKHNNVYSA